MALVAGTSSGDLPVPSRIRHHDGRTLPFDGVGIAAAKHDLPDLSDEARRSGHGVWQLRPALQSIADWPLDCEQRRDHREHYAVADPHLFYVRICLRARQVLRPRSPLLDL